MSFRAGLLPSLVSRPLSSSSRLYHRSSPFQQARIIAKTRTAPRSNSALPLFTFGAGFSFLAYQAFSPSRKLACQSSPNSSPFSPSSYGSPKPEVFGGQPPVESQLSAFQLGFGSVAGICTGIFIKKGLKAIGFILGGAFVLMQYLSSKSIIKVDWARLAGNYDSVLGTKSPTGEIRPPTVGGVWAWTVDFLTANFQQRATFLAGLILGLRLG